MLVHASDTFAVLDSQHDKALIAPDAAPWVLNNPMVDFALIYFWICWINTVVDRNVSAAHAIGLVLFVRLKELIRLVVALFCSPLHTSGPSAASFGLNGLFIIIIIIIIIIIVIIFLLNQTDKDNSVIETSVVSAWAGRFKNTCLVVSPAVVSSCHSDGHRAILELYLHILNRITCSKPSHSGGSGSNILVLLISARYIFCFVWVVHAGLRTTLLREFPVVAHPTTITAGGSGIAVDTLLFRELDGVCTIFYWLHGLLTRGCGESPAGTTWFLVLHRAYVASCHPVDWIVGFQVATRAMMMRVCT